MSRVDALPDGVVRTIDALKVGQSIIAAMAEDSYVIEVLPWHHRWPKNSGPKKRKPCVK